MKSRQTGIEWKVKQLNDEGYENIKRIILIVINSIKVINRTEKKPSLSPKGEARRWFFLVFSPVDYFDAVDYYRSKFGEKNARVSRAWPCLQDS